MRLIGRTVVGEIAEMMLDGTLCEGCGSFIDDSGGMGIPRYCSPQCASDRGAEWMRDQDKYAPRLPRFRPDKIKRREKVQETIAKHNLDGIRDGAKMLCPFCRNKVKRIGFGDHMMSAHRDKWEDASNG